MKSFKRLLFATLYGFAAVVAFSACQRGEKDEPVMPVDEINTPLCFTAQEDSSTVAVTRQGSTVAFPDWEYSFDGQNWQPFIFSEDLYKYGGTEPVVLAKAGDKVYVRNQGMTNSLSVSTSSYIHFNTTGKIAASGNIMSLLSKDDFSTMTKIAKSHTFSGLFVDNTALVSAPLLPATELSKYCYGSMFMGCTNLTTAPELPATTMKGACYADMFDSCINLTSAPALPATMLASHCYDCMFFHCTSLTTAPKLPATTLADNCYNGMFIECTNLTTAPELPATTLADYCYYAMFYNCSSLTTAPELPATTLAADCYSGMFYNCSNLTTAPELPATTLADNCYNGMFIECTNLTNAPELPATELAYGCYWAMFSDCTSLTRAPRLLATTLADYCYDWMFNGCTNMNYIEVAFDQWTTDNATFEWVGNMATEGTFVCPDNLPDERGISRIPEGWTKTNTPANQVSTKRKAIAKANTTGSKNIRKPEILKRTAAIVMPSADHCVLDE